MRGRDAWQKWLYTVDWQPRTLEQGEPAVNMPPRTWLILADAQGVGARLAAQLRGQGDRAVLAYRGEGWRQEGPDTFYVGAERSEDLRRLVAQLVGGGPGVHGVVHLWGLDEAGELVPAARGGCGMALLLVQALVEEQVRPSGLWLVTQDAQAVVSGDRVTGSAQAGLWGMGKVITLEHPELNATCVDLGWGEDVDACAQQLYTEIAGRAGQPRPEREIALRQGARFVARLQRYGLDEDLPVPQGPYRLEVTERGVLDNLRLAPVVRRSPRAGEVEIEVQASGLNFRDVLNVLGAYPGDPGAIGGECAGVVVAVGAGVTGFAPGDEVLAMASGAFSQYVTVDSAYVAHKPAGMRAVEAAALPTAFLTAYCGLRYLAQIKPGDRVLIHAAAGGVGMAAVQLAQQAGAKVFATASPPKWDALRAMGVTHLYNSRTTEFAAQILADTGAQGVDVILNSLTGPGFMEANLAALGAGGYVAEMSKRNIWSPEQVAAVRPDARYVAFDLGEICLQQPPLWQEMWAEIAQLFAGGQLRALPCTVFPMQQAAAALRTMQQARHIGKIVLTPPAGVRNADQSLAVRGSATYLITGGLGALGLTAARWLVEQGARHLLLIGRKGPQPGAAAELDELAQMGVSVRVVQADVAELGELAAALEQIDEGTPLKGVIHCAGVLDDGALLQQSSERFAKVLAPKAQGAWNLHQLTQDMALDFFVLFSSASSVLGNRGQANYAAANACLDALAQHRHARGLPALSINWGAWAEAGMAAGLARSRRAQMAVQGVRMITPAEGTAALARLLGQSAPQVGVFALDWAKLQAREPALARIPLLDNFVAQGVESPKTAGAAHACNLGGRI